ncbi:MAG: ABC transporter substrate-binding protein [Pirellulaceae bacterium]|nr:ABC transporter substrate-binding protein [Pirellulaceae bacterium]
MMKRLAALFLVTFAATPMLAAKPEDLGDLIPKGFNPPTLAELEKQVKWVDRDVVDSLKLLRERQADEKPAGTVAQALAAKNVSPQANKAILSVLGRLPANEKTDVDWDAEWKRHINFDVKSTNPVLFSSVSESDVNGLTGFGLFSFDWNFNAFASSDTVKSWQSSEDHLYDKVVIRDDLVWSDGTPITAHDVEFSFKLIMTESVPVPAVRSGTDKLKYVKAYDDHTLVYFHQESLATNDWNVNFPVIPRHIYERTWAADPSLATSDEHIKYEKDPVSGGPYKIASRSIGSEIVLTRREEYYMHEGKQVRDKPYFKTIRFKVIQEPGVAFLALKGGDIDDLILTPQQWRTQTTDDDFYKNCTKVYDTEWVSFHFLWNCQNPMFADKRTRWAMTYAFDHEEMLRKLRYSLDPPANGIFHPASPWAPPSSATYIKRDLDKAEELLDAAGWKDSDGDGIRDKVVDGKKIKFDFGILCASRQDRIDICNLLKQNLKEVGIEVTVRPLDFAVLQQKLLEHSFEASFGGWGTGTDPDTSENIWGTNQERNYGFYSNPEVDKLFAAGRKEFDKEKRRAIYQKIHTLIAEDQPYTWLFYQNAYYGFNKSMRGYVFSPRGPYHYSPGSGSLWKPVMK